jgi:hypothetical protein
MATTSASGQVAVLAGTCACYGGLIPCLERIQCSVGTYIASQTRACQTTCSAGNVASTPCGSLPPSTLGGDNMAASSSVGTLSLTMSISEQATSASNNATVGDTVTNMFGCSEATAAVVEQCDMLVSECLRGQVVSQPSWCACFSEYAKCLVGHEQCTIVATGIAAIRQSCTAGGCPTTAFCAGGMQSAAPTTVSTVPAAPATTNGASTTMLSIAIMMVVASVVVV